MGSSSKISFVKIEDKAAYQSRPSDELCTEQKRCNRPKSIVREPKMC